MSFLTFELPARADSSRLEKAHRLVGSQLLSRKSPPWESNIRA
jgi:hypothetical protein